MLPVISTPYTMARRMLTIARPTVVLPQPDSPTSPSVSPWSSVEADPVDGLAPRAILRAKTPPVTGKRTRRSSHLAESSWIHQMAAHPVSGRSLDRAPARSSRTLEPLACSASRTCSPIGSSKMLGTVPGIAGRRWRLVAVHRRQGREQPARIRMQRILEQLFHRRDFLNLAAVHHDDALARLRDDGEVVRDQQNRGVLALRP